MSEDLVSIGIIDVLAVYGVHTDLAFVGCSGMYERLQYGLVGVLKFDVFPDKGYVHFCLWVLELFKEFVPRAHVRLCEILYFQMPYHEFVKMLFMHVQRHLIDAPGVYRLYDVARLYIAE